MKAQGIVKIASRYRYFSLLDEHKDEEDNFFSNVTSIADCLDLSSQDFKSFLLKLYGLSKIFDQDPKELQSTSTIKRSEEDLLIETDDYMLNLKIDSHILKVIK